MDTKKPNKIREIVRLQQILRKWRNLATSSSSSGNKKSIQLILKRTLSFSDHKFHDHDHHHQASHTTTTTSSSGGGGATVPKGYLAVCVGEEQKRFVIPTSYLGREAFRALLREAEEEFGFEQTGVLRIPCEVAVFERVLRSMETNNGHQDKRFSHSSSQAALLLHDQSCYNNNHDDHDNHATLGYYCCSSEISQLGFSHHPSDHHSSMCR